MPMDTHAFSRRAALAGTAALMAAPALAEECRIGPPPHEKGPLVWMNMDQIELDAAYDQSAYAPTQRQIQARFASAASLPLQHSPSWRFCTFEQDGFSFSVISRSLLERPGSGCSPDAHIDRRRDPWPRLASWPSYS